MSEQIDRSSATDENPALRRCRWIRWGVVLVTLIALSSGVWWYAVPRRCQLVAEYAGDNRISVTANGFLYIAPQQRAAIHRDWDGKVLAEYRMPPRKSNVSPIASISPDGRTVALLEISRSFPHLLRQWHDGQLLFEEVVSIPEDGAGCPALIAQDNGDLVFLLHNETPLHRNYFKMVSVAIIRHGKMIALQPPWTINTTLAIDGRTTFGNNKFRPMQVSDGRISFGPPSKAITPSASRVADWNIHALSTNATWSVIFGGVLDCSTPPTRVTAWNLRTGNAWDVVFRQEFATDIATITDDGQYTALLGASTPAGKLAPLVQRLPDKTPFRESLLTWHPAILIYHRSGRCIAMLPPHELETMYDDAFDMQIIVSSEHRKLLISDMRTIRLYRW